MGTTTFDLPTSFSNTDYKVHTIRTLEATGSTWTNSSNISQGYLANSCFAAIPTSVSQITTGKAYAKHFFAIGY